MKDEISATIEDYLGILYVLERDAETASGVRLAELLGVSTPTVTNTLKRMVRDGLIELDGAHAPRLTSAGLEAGRSVMRRHMLPNGCCRVWFPGQRLMIRLIKWKHAISPEVELALLADFNQPELCPHGNPLPGHEALVSEWKALTLVPADKRVIIRRIHELAEEIPDLLAFLEERGIALEKKR